MRPGQQHRARSFLCKRLGDDKLRTVSGEKAGDVPILAQALL